MIDISYVMDKEDEGFVMTARTIYGEFFKLFPELGMQSKSYVMNPFMANTIDISIKDGRKVRFSMHKDGYEMTVSNRKEIGR